MLDVGGDLVDVERALRDEDDVRAAGQAAVQRDPSGVAAHDLADQRAVVALGRGVEPVDGLGGDADGGVEAEGVVGRAEVVVDRLRDADHAHDAVVLQLVGDPEGVLAADGDQRVDLQRLDGRPDPVQPAVDFVRVRPAGAEHRAAAGQQPTHGLDVERDDVGIHRAAPSVAEADEVVTVDLDALADDGTDDRIQARAVSAAGQHADSHIGRLARPARARARDFGHQCHDFVPLLICLTSRKALGRADPSQVRRMQESTASHSAHPALGGGRRPAGGAGGLPAGRCRTR